MKNVVARVRSHINLPLPYSLFYRPPKTGREIEIFWVDGTIVLLQEIVNCLVPTPKRLNFFKLLPQKMFAFLACIPREGLKCLLLPQFLAPITFFAPTAYPKSLDFFAPIQKG